MLAMFYPHIYTQCQNTPIAKVIYTLTFTASQPFPACPFWWHLCLETPQGQVAARTYAIAMNHTSFHTVACITARWWNGVKCHQMAQKVIESVLHVFSKSSYVTPLFSVILFVIALCGPAAHKVAVGRRAREHRALMPRFYGVLGCFHQWFFITSEPWSTVPSGNLVHSCGKSRYIKQHQISQVMFLIIFCLLPPAIKIYPDELEAKLMEISLQR